MKMIDAQSIELNANHRSFVVQMAQQIYSQLAGVGNNTKIRKGFWCCHIYRDRSRCLGRGTIWNRMADTFLGGLGGAIEQAMGIAQESLPDHRSNPEFQRTETPGSFLLKHLDLNQGLGLRQIINTLKNYSLPFFNSSPYFLNYPAMVLPMYIPNQAQLYEFKWCLINSVTVDCILAGTAAFFTGTQAPVEVSLALRLVELELWFQGDPFLTQGMLA